jgi:hypothetical protein
MRQHLEEVDQEDEHEQQEEKPEPEVPERHSPARDDVFFPQPVVVDSEQARPPDEAVENQVEQAAEGGHREDREHERPADAQLLDLVQPDEERGAGENRNSGRGAAERPPLVAQLAGLLR